MTISNESRSRIKRIFEPIALAMGRAGLTPDALTLIGFGITVVGSILVGLQLWVVGGLVVFIGGVFDMFDGTLARATGQASPLGAFMDSVFDKLGEIIVFLGIIAGLQAAGAADAPILVAVAAMGASIMVSYTRAKSDGLGFSSGMGMAAVGIMPREVRLVIDLPRHRPRRHRPRARRPPVRARRRPRRRRAHRDPADPPGPPASQVHPYPVALTRTNGDRPSWPKAEATSAGPTGPTVTAAADARRA